MGWEGEVEEELIGSLALKEMKTMNISLAGERSRVIDCDMT